MKEFNTQRKIGKYLISSLQLDESCIKRWATNGSSIDVYGKGEPRGKKSLIAVKANIDAPEMREEGELEYKSTTNVAHMSGNDGQTTQLLGGLSYLLDNLKNIPSNKGVRYILFVLKIKKVYISSWRGR